MKGGEAGAQGAEEGVAEGGDVLHDAAGEGEGWDPCRVRREALEAEDDDVDEVGEFFGFVAEDGLGYGVSVLGGGEDEGSEARDVGGGGGVGVLDEVVDGG